MDLSSVNLESFRNVPAPQKAALLFLLVGGIVAGFYYNYVEPKSAEIEGLQAENSKLEGEIQTLAIKVKHLDQLIAANKQLEIELAKKSERLPPEEEAIMLLKQVSDLGLRLGLNIKLWKPGAPAVDPSKLFVKMPVSVEVSGGYHTATLFFDRINKLQQIVTVSGLKMGAPKLDGGRAVSQTTFNLIAYAAPPGSPAVKVAAASTAPGQPAQPVPSGQ